LPSRRPSAIVPAMCAGIEFRPFSLRYRIGTVEQHQRKYRLPANADDGTVYRDQIGEPAIAAVLPDG
jgi:hypothetical protein